MCKCKMCDWFKSWFTKKEETKSCCVEEKKEETAVVENSPLNPEVEESKEEEKNII